MSLLVYACAPTRVCADEAAACGGNVQGSWRVVDACQEPTASPPLQLTYSNQPATTAREIPPTVTSSDWCSSLHVDAFNSVTNFTFPTDSARVTGGTFTLSDDASYQALLTIDGEGRAELAPACLSRFGARPTCQSLTTGLNEYATGLPADPPRPSYANVVCVDGDNGGCVCTYAMTLAGSLKGRWSTAGSVFTSFDPSLRLPSQFDYCATDDYLTLTGKNGATMFNPGGALNQEGQISSAAQVIGSAGLRTLTMQRVRN